MPPKKKLPKANEEPIVPEKNVKPQEKVQTVNQEVKKEEPKPEPKNIVTETAQLPVAQASNQNGSALNVQAPERIVKTIDTNSGNIKTEAELIEERRKKFGIVSGSISQQPQNIRKQRLKKFGGLVEDEQTILKRKQKFDSNPINAPQDEDTVRRRKQKFGNVGVADDKDTLEARKLKFTAPQAVLSLDDEIQKSKGINKFHKKFNNHQRHSFKNRNQMHRKGQ